MKIEAVCTNPSDILLKVTAEMNIAQWDAMLIHIDKAGWHHLTAEFMRAIREAIDQIKRREVMQPKKAK